MPNPRLGTKERQRPVGHLMDARRSVVPRIGLAIRTASEAREAREARGAVDAATDGRASPTSAQPPCEDGDWHGINHLTQPLATFRTPGSRADEWAGLLKWEASHEIVLPSFETTVAQVLVSEGLPAGVVSGAEPRQVHCKVHTGSVQCILDFLEAAACR